MSPCLGLINVLEQLTELRPAVCVIRVLVHSPGAATLKTLGAEDAGRGRGAAMPCLGLPPSRRLHASISPETLGPCPLGIFYEGFFTQV